VHKWDEPLSLDWREQATTYLARLNIPHKGRVWSELLQREEQFLDEMKAVQPVRAKIPEHMPLHSLPPDKEMAKIMKDVTPARHLRDRPPAQHRAQPGPVAKAPVRAGQT